MDRFSPPNQVPSYHVEHLATFSTMTPQHEHITPRMALQRLFKMEKTSGNCPFSSYFGIVPRLLFLASFGQCPFSLADGRYLCQPDSTHFALFWVPLPPARFCLFHYSVLDRKAEHCTGKLSQ